MKSRRFMGWAGILAMMTIAIAAPLSAGERSEAFHGEIGDSQCALNVHSLTRSHREMLKKKAIGKTSADCARYCVKYMGGVFVLQVKDKVYKLDNQSLANIYAGQKVIVTGKLDAQTDTITVESMVPTKY
ncbi:MAG: hypothetical protein KGL75_01895 [Acidobacteriota bacterium]|nr:hypothetical protein [Acidobacteriota bacterium]